VVFALLLLLLGLIFAIEAIERWQRRWSVRRAVLAADWAAARSVLRLAAEHWRQTTAMLNATDRPVEVRRDGGQR
jgi:hypothetical protein